MSIRDGLHEIFSTGTDGSDEHTYLFPTAERAERVRRELYRERARLNRERPDHGLTAKANELVFTLACSGCMLVVRKRRAPQLARDLARVVANG